MKYLSVCLLGCALFSSLTWAKEPALEKLVREFMDKQGSPGLSIAVLKKGKLWWAKGFGASDVENQVLVTAETKFRFASISKPISAIAALQLVEKGQLSLEENITTYCPQFPRKKSAQTGQVVSINTRQLIGHLSGIRHYQRAADGSYPGYDHTKHYKTTREAMRFFENDDLVAIPGEKFVYSTFGYTVLACVVEGVVGKPFNQWISEFLLRSNMSNTVVDNHFELIDHRAQGYTRSASGKLRNAGLADTSIKVAGGGLIGTASDLVHLLEGLQSGKLLQTQTQKRMFESLKNSQGVRTKYGLGWTVDEYRGKSLYRHGGYQHRVTNVLYYVPEKQLGVAILNNLEDAPVKTLANKVLDYLW